MRGIIGGTALALALAWSAGASAKPPTPAQVDQAKDILKTSNGYQTVEGLSLIHI